MLFTNLLRKRISIITIVEATLKQKVDAEDEHDGRDVVRKILYMVLFGDCLLVGVVCLFELVIYVWYWTDQKHYDLNSELNEPVASLEPTDLLISMAVLLIKVFKPFMLITLSNSEEAHADTVKRQHGHLVILCTDLVVSVKE